MRVHVLTLFPEMIENALNTSITGRAIEKGLLEIDAINIRDYSHDKHFKVDDYTYGGGAGLLMKAEPVCEAYDALTEKLGKKPRVVFMTPVGETFSQKKAEELAKEEDLTILCGHYEGIDERALDEIVTDRISIGDYVLTGGELASLVVIDAVSRLVPGVLHNDISADTESFNNGLLEYPQFTRPESFRGRKVPEVLLSGDHKKVDDWRFQQSLIRTARFRPDLYIKFSDDNEAIKEYYNKHKELEEEISRILKSGV